MVSLFVVMVQVGLHCATQGVLAKEDHAAGEFRFEAPEESFHVRIHVGRTNGCLDWLYAFTFQCGMKRLAKLCIAIQNEMCLAQQKTIVMVGKLERCLLHLLFVRIRRTAGKVDAACF